MPQPTATNTLIIPHQPNLSTSAIANHSKIIDLKSFDRFLVIFPTTLLAQQSYQQLKQLGLRVFYGQHTLLDSPKEYLRVPAKQVNFLLSPPGEMPVGWIQTEEEHPGVTHSPSLIAERIEISDLNDFVLDANDSQASRDELFQDFRKAYQFDPVADELPLLVVDEYSSTTGSKQQRIPQTRRPSI